LDTDSSTTYRHTQQGPWYLLLLAIAILQFTLAFMMRNESPPLAWLFLCVAILMLTLMISFFHLTTEDRGTYLSIRFGPLPLFRKQIPYSEIVSTEISKTSFLDGWGIHYSIRGGWVWNIWGFRCVLIQQPKQKLWIGTDQPERLNEMLLSKIAIQSNDAVSSEASTDNAQS
jgi:hypothetical protein